jgi:hypothetical protein
MPATTITITSEQRDGLYELVRNHLGSVGDLFDALERQKDFAKAERLGHQIGEDLRLLVDIGWREKRRSRVLRADDAATRAGASADAPPRRSRRGALRI